MAGQQSSKGNPASKRMLNPKLKEKRQRSWLRGEARKKRHREENEAARRANDKKLADLGLKRTTTPVERVVNEHTITVRRPDSPQRTIRLAKGSVAA